MGAPFEAIVGSEHARPDDGELDGVRIEAVVRPGSAEQVAVCLVAAREGKRLLISGGRTKLHWGNPIQADRVTRLDTTRLDATFDLQADEGIVTVGAGVPLGRLARAASEAGKRTLLPAFPENATIGGTLAADPIGPDHSLDRRLRVDVLGLQVALPSGEVTHAGGKVVKNVTGFDLVRLYCGSLGTLGVITEATLRLRALPESRLLLVSRHADGEAALRAAAEICEARVDPAGIALCFDAGEPTLLCMLEGHSESVAQLARRLPGQSDDVARWERLSRDAAVPAPAGELARVRLGGRASDIRAICAALEQAAGADCLRLVLPRTGVAFAEVDEHTLDVIWERAAREGWALFLERASVQAKIRLDVFGPGIEALPLMHAIKTRFDPGGVLAPGRFAGRL